MSEATARNKFSSILRHAIIIVAFIFMLPLVPIAIGTISPVGARWGFLLLLAAAAVALFRPLPVPLMRTKLGAVGLIYLSCFGAASGFSEHTDGELEILKVSNPAGYLETVRASRGDDAWLKALAELRPDEHAAEVARREQEEQERQGRREAERAQQEVERQAREHAEREQRIFNYVDQLHRELEGLSDFDVGTYTESREGILLALAVFGAWAQIVEEGEALPLSNEQQALRQRLRASLADVQSRALPRLRDAYGPMMRKELWEHDITAKTFGPRFTTVQFVAGAFAANRNIKAFNEGAWEALNMLRFKQVRYKWYEEDNEYTYYNIESPSDRELVRWSDNGRYQTVN